MHCQDVKKSKQKEGFLKRSHNLYDALTRERACDGKCHRDAFVCNGASLPRDAPTGHSGQRGACDRSTLGPAPCPLAPRQHTHAGASPREKNYPPTHQPPFITTDR